MDNDGDLSSVPFLNGLAEDDRRELAGFGEVIELHQGEQLIRQFDPQDSLYIVLAGRISVSRLSSKRGITLGDIGAGECFGEMNVLDPVTASADVRVEEPGSAWRISRDALERFVHEHPNAGVELMRGLGIHLSRRLRRLTDMLVTSVESALSVYECEWD